MQRVVIEYQDRTYTPPALADVIRASTITATVTSAKGSDATRISGSGSLCDLHLSLEELNFEHHGIQPVRLHTSGRYRPLWREVWSKEEEEKHMNTWSLRAQKNHQQGQARARARQEDEQIMQAGPHLADDGYTLIVPSRWYQLEAVAFWQSYGFRFDRSRLQWTRDTRRLHEGKRYSPQAWLESTRREFYKFWPKLVNGSEEKKGEDHGI